MLMKAHFFKVGYFYILLLAFEITIKCEVFQLSLKWQKKKIIVGTKILQIQNAESFIIIFSTKKLSKK